MAEDRTLLALNRIACALGVSVGAFYASDSPAPLQSAAGAEMDAMEMRSTFAVITDPAKRRTCIDFVRQIAEEESDQSCG